MDTRTAVLEKPAAGRKSQTSARALPVATLQRKCPCGAAAANAAGECQQCKKKRLQRRAADRSELSAAPPIVDEVLESAGQPLDAATRNFMEPRFGYDFSKVRVHSGPRAAESVRAVNALAYTVGSNVVFGSGQYAPGKASGRKILAHELTHVVQQRGARNPAPQAKLEVGPANDSLEQEADRMAEQVAGVSDATTLPPTDPNSLRGGTVRLQRDIQDPAPTETAAEPPAAAPIVDDEAQQLGPGQMRKTEFLDKLRVHVCSVADAVLATVGRSAQGCPVIERWIGHLREKNVQHIERSLRKYASPSAQASAQDYIIAVGEKVREGVTRWAATGELSGVPPELMSEMMGGGGILGTLGSMVSGIASGFSGAISGIGRLFAKGKDGGARQANPEAVQTQLGTAASARPLESAVRGRMERAFDYDFSRVRVHADSRAAQLSSSLNARAFAIGSDIAFAAGEYNPGTLIGDALIAHELAHVMQQQGGASPAATGEAAYQRLEEDADFSAVRAIVSLWGGATSAVNAIFANAAPRLRSGLKLQRCGPSLRNPQDVQREFTAAQTQILNGLGSGQSADDVRLTLQQLQAIFADQLQDAGSNTGAQARAQQGFLENVQRLRESYRLQMQMSQRYHLRFTSERHEIWRQVSPPMERYHIRTWSQDDLQKVDAILSRAPAGSLANVQKIQREPGTDSSVPAAWQQNVRTLFIYNPFFDQSADEQAQFLLHEIGHSAAPLQRVGTFASLPTPEWMQLSDWRTSTETTIGSDIGIPSANLANTLRQVDQARRPEQAFPRPVRVRDRMVVVDRYGPEIGPRQYLHYAFAHNAEFVTDYARSHPADDLAESYAKSVLHPRETRQILDVGPRGVLNKWGYLTILLEANADLARHAQEQSAAPPSSGGAAQGASQPANPPAQATGTPEERRDRR